MKIFLRLRNLHKHYQNKTEIDMKVKVKKSELQECVRRAVVRALNEAAQQNINEWGYGEDEDEEMSRLVDRFVKDPKNRYKRKDPKAAEARKAAMADIKKETDSEKHDDAAIAAREKADKAED